VGIPPLKYRKSIVGVVLTVFETLKNIDFQGGITTFSKKKRQRFLKGIAQDLFFMHRDYNDKEQ